MAPVTDFIATEARLGARNYQPLGVVLSRGEGVFVWDTEGNRYLDCLSAYSAVNQGHCHPKITAAIKAQADRLESITGGFMIGYLGLLGLVLAARGFRTLHERRVGMINLSYGNGRTIRVPKGLSVLEASLRYQVPHASVCGGRAIT